MTSSICWIASVVCLALTLTVSSAKPPHIVFIVADDLGWNDIGWRNPAVLTPHLDRLAGQGVILNQSYVQPVCTPSRTAFMSGIYPFKAGTQHGVLMPEQAACVPLNVTFLPQELKKLGYATHMVGKWHLGFCNWECTPTYRGFDTFFGFYNGGEDHYNHTIGTYLDLRDNKVVASQYNGMYSTTVFGMQAQSIVRSHDSSQPLFLYLPFQAPHEPLQVPKKYENMYPNIKDRNRRLFSAMVTAVDEAVGNLTSALDERDMLNETLFFFTGDNGGWVTFGGNNYPLRGGKITIWEGGTRASAFVSGAGLQKTGYVHNGMMHAVDYFPTIISAAGGKVGDHVDGIDQWEMLSTGAESKRTEFVYNLDDKFPPIEGHAAIRVGDYKLIQGYPGLYSNWYPPATSPEDMALPLEEDLAAPGTRLFNIKDDPTEHVDLASKLPEVVQKLEARMKFYHSQMVPADSPPNDPKGSPKYFHNVWSPGWC